MKDILVPSITLNFLEKYSLILNYQNNRLLVIQNNRLLI